MYTPGSKRAILKPSSAAEAAMAEMETTPPRRSYSSNSSTFGESPKNSATAAASWVFFSPQKEKRSKGSDFYDYYGSVDSPTLQDRDPYKSSKLMRKNLLSLIPLEGQGGLSDALTRMYMCASEKGPEDEVGEIQKRANKARLMTVALFTAYDTEFHRGMPLPRSQTAAGIGLAQALKDSCRERVVISGEEIK
jgi:hypothetical protein